MVCRHVSDIAIKNMQIKIYEKVNDARSRGGKGG